MKTLPCLFITLLILAGATQFASAAIRTVTNTADSGAGSLRDTITASASGDTIHFSGLLLGTIHIVLTSGELVIDKGLTLEGLGRRILIDGHLASRGFRVTVGGVILSGLTITNGYATDVGGGLFNVGILTMNNCTIVRSSAGDNAGNGNGGGLFNQGTLTVNNCTFDRNNSESDGGGLFNQGTLTVNNSTVFGSTAGNFTDHPSGGGGIASTGTLTVNSSTITQNTASMGGGVHKLNGTATLRNTIIAANGQTTLYPDVLGAFTSQGFNLIGITDGSFGWIATDRTGSSLTPLDAQLGLMQNIGGFTIVFAPLPTSPALDAGNSGGLTSDQIGQPRPFDNFSIPNATGGDGSDIGAYEVQGPVITAQPQPPSQLVLIGQNVTYTVTATDLGPMTYQWYKNGAGIAGATSSTYTLNNAQLVDAGNYSVVISDSFGASTGSDPAALSVGFSLTRTSTGSGSVILNPDQVVYTNNQTVTLTASPASSWLFDSWSGDVGGTNVSTNLVMTANKSITANFLPGYSLTLATNGSGAVVRSPDQTLYVSNSPVLLTAAPSPGWLFGGWSGSASGSSNSLSLTMTNNKSITANFYQPTLTVGVSGGGVVIKNPDQLTYAADSTANLSAYPASGWRFSNWSGDASGTATPLAVTMTTNKFITANFTATNATACVPVPAGVVAWWPGAGNANDIAGTNNGILLGGATYLPGKVGQAFSFNGNDAAVYCPGGPALTFANECSVEAWIRPDDVANYQQIFYQANNASVDYWALGLSTNGSFRLEVNRGSGNPANGVVNSPPGLLSVGTWAHIAATFQSGSMSLYFNGTNVAVKSLGASYIFGSVPTAAYLGARVASQRFAGLIDELSVYNRALSFSQFQLIYFKGSAGKCLTPAYVGDVLKSSNSFNLSWLAQKGMGYRLQYKSNLDTVTPWVDVIGDVIAITNTASKVDSTLGNAPRRFYRVELLK